MGPPNNNIDPGIPGPLNLIFANKFKWATNNNIDPGSLGPFNIVLPNNLNGTLQ